MKKEQTGIITNILRTIAGVAFGLTFWPASSDLYRRAAATYNTANHSTAATERPGQLVIQPYKDIPEKNSSKTQLPAQLSSLTNTTSPAGPSYAPDSAE